MKGSHRRQDYIRSLLHLQKQTSAYASDYIFFRINLLTRFDICRYMQERSWRYLAMGEKYICRRTIKANICSSTLFKKIKGKTKGLDLLQIRMRKWFKCSSCNTFLFSAIELPFMCNWLDVPTSQAALQDVLQRPQTQAVSGTWYYTAAFFKYFCKILVSAVSIK